MMTSTPPSSTAQPSISDLRRNAERQSREQNSVTRLLAILGYTFLGGLVLVAGLAAYGAYVIFGRLNEQSATLAQLESTTRSQTRELRDSLKATQEDLGSAKRTIQQQQVTITRQQEAVSRLETANRQRAAEIATLRSRTTVRRATTP
jgi:uncharacterized protein HemX